MHCLCFCSGAQGKELNPQTAFFLLKNFLCCMTAKARSAATTHVQMWLGPWRGAGWGIGWPWMGQPLKYSPAEIQDELNCYTDAKVSSWSLANWAVLKSKLFGVISHGTNLYIWSVLAATTWKCKILGCFLKYLPCFLQLLQVLWLGSSDINGGRDSSHLHYTIANTSSLSALTIHWSVSPVTPTSYISKYLQFVI